MNMPKRASCHHCMRRSRSSRVEVVGPASGAEDCERARGLNEVRAVAAPAVLSRPRLDKVEGFTIVPSFFYHFHPCRVRGGGVRYSVFAKRVIEPELLDHLPPEEARRNLADLVRINRRFGGHAVLRKALQRVIRPEEGFTALDIGAASGDTARLIQQIFPRASVTSLDCNGVNLGGAPQPKLIADAFRLPFAPESFDIVLSSLFLHHFEDAHVSALLRSFYRIARRAVVVCDLERHVLPYLFLPATKYLLGWQRVTIHDGVISVRAAFRAKELLELSRRAGIEGAEIQEHRPAFRLSLVALKQGSGGHSEEDTHRGRTVAKQSAPA
jgi:ubiquinone/menaquinone biosynthesis C-methylase UbiE